MEATEIADRQFFFDESKARKYGLECAVFIKYLQNWIIYNKKLGKNFHEGRTWMYQSQEEMAASLPFSRDQIYRIIKKLEDDGVIIKKNFNKVKYDRTCWYAFENEELFGIARIRAMGDCAIDCANSRNELRETAQPIPIYKQDIKTKTTTTQVARKARVVVSSKKMEVKTSPPKPKEIHKCFDSLPFDLTNKQWLSDRFSEDICQKALQWIMHPSTKIKTSYEAAMVWACEKQPEIPKSKEEISSINKQQAEELEKKAKSPRQTFFEVFSKYVHIYSGMSQNPGIIISYEEKGFMKKLKDALTLYKIQVAI